MNIEKLLSKAALNFKNSIITIIPFIVLYTIIQYIVTPSAKYPDSTADDISGIIIYLEMLSQSSIILIFASFFLNIIYNISVIKFIFSFISKSKTKINISHIVNSFGRILGIYFILIGIPLILFLFLSSNMLGALFCIYISIYIYLRLFFAQYFVIQNNQPICQSILESHYLVTNNLYRVFAVIGLNLIFILVTFYISSILASLIITMNFKLAELVYSLLFNIGLYYTSIFNIHFYQFIINREKTPINMDT